MSEPLESVAPPSADTNKTTTPTGRLYKSENYNVKSRRKRPQFDIENELIRKKIAEDPAYKGPKPKPTPEASKCEWCHRAWTVKPYYDEHGNDVNLSVDDAIRDLTMRLNRRVLQLCDVCFAELETRRNAK